LLFVKREVYHCDCLQFLVHLYSQVHLIESFIFDFNSQYILLALTSCSTSNIMHYTIILKPYSTQLYYKLMFLVLRRLIAINRD